MIVAIVLLIIIAIVLIPLRLLLPNAGALTFADFTVMLLQWGLVGMAFLLGGLLILSDIDGISSFIWGAVGSLFGVACIVVCFMEAGLMLVDIVKKPVEFDMTECSIETVYHARRNSSDILIGKRDGQDFKLDISELSGKDKSALDGEDTVHVVYYKNTERVISVTAK